MLKMFLSKMNSLPPYSLIITGVVLLLSVLYFYLKNRKLPPGPSGLPYLGLWPHLTYDECHLQLQEYGRKYGDIFSFTYMGNLMINLGTLKAIREVQLQKADCFEERMKKFSIFTYCMKDGLALSNGEPWKVLRKHFLQSLKEYGMKSLKETGDAPIYESLAKATEDIREKKGTPFNVIDLLSQRCIATTRKVIFGVDGVTDEELTLINENFAASMEGMTGNRMMYMGPVANLLFTFVPSYRRAIDHHLLMSNTIRKVCRRIEANFDGENPTNMIECFYYERNVRKNKKDPTAKYFTEKALVETLAQFVGDLVISVSYFMGGFIHALVRHPEEQDKIFDEIKEVIGLQRLPADEDRGRMPYTNAFFNEVIRTCNFFSLFPSMECTKETTIRGFRIPKGAVTMYNFWAAHYDPETFQNPEKFNPERYISKPKERKTELPALFGIGKRACTGEPLVMMYTFLFVTTLVKEFRISEAKELESESTMYMTTGNMEFRFQPRSET